jgi:hypothetical protein
MQRLSREILDLLQLGPVTNVDLHRVCMHPNARLYEIRRFLRWLHGRGVDWQPISCAEDKVTGLATYSLAPEARVR